LLADLERNLRVATSLQKICQHLGIAVLNTMPVGPVALLALGSSTSLTPQLLLMFSFYADNCETVGSLKRGMFD
jgi:hypothetical protein